MCYRVGTAQQKTLLSGFLKLKGTLVKITRPPSGGPFAPRKAREGTVSQGDQELGLRHHRSRYPDKPRAPGPGYSLPLSATLVSSYRNSQTHAECHTKTYILADETWRGQGDKEAVEPLHKPLLIPHVHSVSETQVSRRHGF